MGFPQGMFQKKAQFTGRTDCTGVSCEPQPEPGAKLGFDISRVQPTINTTGGWVRPTRAGWALPPDAPLRDDFAAGMGQTVAGPPKMRPVSAGLFNRNSGTIDSREAVKKYGGQFIFK
ncbi:hypothetical protein LUZ63_019117 [Rhynchospora breviuscula]|uniref:Uncharacterized protein n=1 Tax=Rhynchospora breviuscula TaxID=2022672 RepID=A0A9Q0C5R6_9POAL|nr:hypothetical protein LUZ63_019117 [Rhynchospora breviuscula]